jgi:hypothetical protein
MNSFALTHDDPPYLLKTRQPSDFEVMNRNKTSFLSICSSQTQCQGNRNLGATGSRIRPGDELARFSSYVTYSRWETKEHTRNPNRHGKAESQWKLSLSGQTLGRETIPRHKQLSDRITQVKYYEKLCSSSPTHAREGPGFRPQRQQQLCLDLIRQNQEENCNSPFVNVGETTNHASLFSHRQLCQ